MLATKEDQVALTPQPPRLGVQQVDKRFEISFVGFHISQGCFLCHLCLGREHPAQAPQGTRIVVATHPWLGKVVTCSLAHSFSPLQPNH